MNFTLKSQKSIIPAGFMIQPSARFMPSQYQKMSNGCYFQLAPVPQNFSQNVYQVVEKEAVAESTLDSPISNINSNFCFTEASLQKGGSYAPVKATHGWVSAKNVSEYCTCNLYNNCTSSDDTTQYNGSCNELSMSLNKETKRCQDAELSQEKLDAQFLFQSHKLEPVSSKVTQISSSASSTKSLSTVNSEVPIFKV